MSELGGALQFSPFLDFSRKLRPQGSSAWAGWGIDGACDNSMPRPAALGRLQSFLPAHTEHFAGANAVKSPHFQ